jgi:hypothetical protein
LEVEALKGESFSGDPHREPSAAKAIEALERESFREPSAAKAVEALKGVVP